MSQLTGLIGAIAVIQRLSPALISAALAPIDAYLYVGLLAMIWIPVARMVVYEPIEQPPPKR